MRTNTTLRVVV